MDGLAGGSSDSTLSYQLAYLSNDQDRQRGGGGIREFDEVVVTALRFAPTLPESPSFVTMIGSTRLNLGVSSSLAGAIASVPGIHIKDYGGTSGLKTISQRGLGAEHTLVLLNGMRVSSFQNGLVDLGLFPIGEIERIEVLHGGQSAVHGSDAIGGVVNLVTRPQTEPISAALESAFGSFGYQRIKASGGALWGDFGVRASLANERSTEDYPFLFHNGPSVEEVTRTNADFSARYGTLETFADLGPDSRLISFARAYQSDRGVGGSVLSPSSSSNARQDDEDYILQLSLRSGLGGNRVLTVGAQVHSAYQRYQDPDLRAAQAAGLDTWFKNNDHRGSVSLFTPLFDDIDITLGGELAATTASGTSMAEKFTRWHGSSFLAGKASILREQSVLKELVVYPSLRVDGFTGVSPSLSPQLALMLKFEGLNPASTDPLEPYLRASASKNFRVPTFNELYYQGGGGIGNPLLKPEYSRGFEVGGGISGSLLGRHVVDLMYFETKMTDRIVWVAAGNFGVTPRNIRSVNSTGFEVSWNWKPDNGPVSLLLGYTNLSSLKTSRETPEDPNVNTSLVYIPGETASASLDWIIPVETIGIRTLEGEVAYNYVGLRYTSEDNEGSLPAYQLVDLGLLINWGLNSWHIGTKLDVLNVFDADYQVILGYPMPMRSFRLTFSLGY